jgi:hypothetical protein
MTFGSLDGMLYFWWFGMMAREISHHRINYSSLSNINTEKADHIPPGPFP